MIKGLYSAASAMLAGLNEQSVLAHNVANMDTPGFKQVLDSLGDFLKAPVLHPPADVSGENRMAFVGGLGLGVENGAQITDYTDGGLLYTAETLDMAIQGPGFFRIMTPDGERYTRDGRFSLDVDGNLVTVDGFKVLDDGGQEIQITSQGAIAVSTDGTLAVDGEVIGKLGVAAFVDPENELVREDSNIFSAVGEPAGEQLGYVEQGYLEGSNVNPAEIMTRMVQVTRHYEAAQRMVQIQDTLLSKAIQSLGTL